MYFLLSSSSSLIFRMFRRLIRSPIMFFDMNPVGKDLRILIFVVTLLSNENYYVRYFLIVLSKFVEAVLDNI
jgi:hypothetical protein